MAVFFCCGFRGLGHGEKIEWPLQLQGEFTGEEDCFIRLMKDI